MRIAIVGAGLSGLACARTLRAAGEDIVLFEKSRGFGGRAATRRRADICVDHGMPAFDAGAQLDGVVALSHCGVWDTPDGGRVTGVPGMSAWPHALGQEIDTRLGTRIERIERGDGNVRLRDDAGRDAGVFRRVVVAVPAPQALDLLGDIDAVFGDLRAVRYRPCCTLLLGPLGDDSHLPALLRPANGPITMIVRDATKPAREERLAGWVAHASAEWSSAHLELEKPEIAARLLPAFADATGLSVGMATHVAGHRWRYSQPVTTLSRRFLLSSDSRLGCCGDYFGTGRSGGDAMAALRSGVSLAEAMLAV